MCGSPDETSNLRNSSRESPSAGRSGGLKRRPDSPTQPINSSTHQKSVRPGCSQDPVHCKQGPILDRCNHLLRKRAPAEQLPKEEAARTWSVRSIHSNPASNQQTHRPFYSADKNAWRPSPARGLCQAAHVGIRERLQYRQHRTSRLHRRTSWGPNLPGTLGARTWRTLGLARGSDHGAKRDNIMAPDPSMQETTNHSHGAGILSLSNTS